jgi:hypothetical protein
MLQDLVAGSLMALTTLAQAHPPEGGMGMMGQSSMTDSSMMGGSMMSIGMARMLQLPDLSDEQRQRRSPTAIVPCSASCLTSRRRRSRRDLRYRMLRWKPGS